MFSAFPIEFASPLDLLTVYDDDVNSGAVSVHEWQKKKLKALGRKLTDEEILFECLLAANGSGKSQFILAPFVVWMSLNFVESLTIVTTASGEQLDTQAFRYISRLCEKINFAHKSDYPDKVFDIKYRRITCNITGSFIDMFATDEPGKAEGRHPLRHKGEFAIVVDEAKTVADPIFDALERCRGFTRRLDISSPGTDFGHLWDICTIEGSPYNIDKITAFDCPHIRKKDIEWTIKKHGINDAFVRSSIFAEFTSDKESVVLTREMLRNCQETNLPKIYFADLRAGLDLSAGGDESVLSVWKGNEQLALETFRYSDTTQGVNHIIMLINKYGLKSENIYADDGGIGRGMIDLLHKEGYKVKRILNQSSPFDTTRYANRGTEMWFSFKRFVEEKQVIFQKDDLQFRQLTTRHFLRQKLSGKIILESKQEARRKGHPSPDRADACVLAWSMLFFPNQILEKELSKHQNKDQAETEIKKGVSVEILADLLRKSKLQDTKAVSNLKDGSYIRLDFSFNQDRILTTCNKNNRRLSRFNRHLTLTRN